MTSDSVNSPAYYNQYQGFEVIELVEQMNFCLGNAVKYLTRAGFKNPETELEDLKKAAWYIRREISRDENASNRDPITFDDWMLYDQMNFNRGSAVKLVVESINKDVKSALDNLAAALGHIEREILRMTNSFSSNESTLIGAMKG